MTLHTLTFKLEEPTGVPRHNWPVSRGVPFPKGLLLSCDHLQLLDRAGLELPLQAHPLSTWADGSLRWVLLHFQADLAPQETAWYTLRAGPEVRRAVTPPGVRVIQEDGRLLLDTGPLQVMIAAGRGFGLLEQAWLNGRPMLASAEHQGFVLEDEQGRIYASANGDLHSINVEQAGPLQAVVHLRGDHRSARGERLFGWEARLYAHAAQPWLEVEYTFINDANEQFSSLKRVSFDLQPVLGTGRRALCGAYGDLYETEQELSLFGDQASSQGVFAGLLIYDQSGQRVEVAYPGEMSHKVAHGWIDLSDDEGGVAVAIRRAVQLYPKQLKARAGRIEVDLWPERAGLLRWHQGMARTHRFLLSFHAGSGAQAEVNKLCTCYEQDLLLWSPEAYTRPEAFGPLLPYEPEHYPRIEIALRDQFMQWHHTNRSTGFLDYGDHPQHGGFAREKYMANNEADLTHCLAMQFGRTGEELYHVDMEATAWHLMDVDIVHHTTYDPLELGGARIHGDAHVQYNCEGYEQISVASSHMWTEGLLEYYFLTGHPRALQIARGIGDCLLRMLDHGWAMPPYKVTWHSVRDSGWPLIALTALYAATGEAKWLQGCRRIVDALVASQTDDLEWGLHLGWHRSLAPMHLGIVMTGLAHYDQLSNDERARASLVRAAHAMLEHCTYPDGALMYVDNPGWRWNYYSGVAYESLGYVWSLTGQTRFLQLGWLAHRRCLTSTGLSQMTGTTLADWWRGNLRYMAWADQAGLLTDLEIA